MLLAAEQRLPRPLGRSSTGEGGQAGGRADGRAAGWTVRKLKQSAGHYDYGQLLA